MNKNLNKSGKVRLKAVQLALSKEKTLKEIGEMFEVHYSTISEWVRMFNTGGLERLNVPLRPSKKVKLDAEKLELDLEKAPAKFKNRLNRLLSLARGERLKDIAEREGVSVQYIMLDRRNYIAGKLLPTPSKKFSKM